MAFLKFSKQDSYHWFHHIYDIMLPNFNYSSPLTKGAEDYGEQLKWTYLIMCNNGAQVS